MREIPQGESADHIKTILVVSLDGPDYDRSTASRMTYHYLKLFIRMGFRVIFAGYYENRVEPYASEMERLGVQILHGNGKVGAKHWIQEHGDELDYAYLIFPFVAEKYLRLIRKHTRAKVFYNASDLFFLREMRNYQIEKDPQLLRSARQWKNREYRIFNHSDVIHVVSAFEKKILMRKFPTKKIRCIPVCMYELNQEEVRDSYESRRGLLFVGTFTHRPNIDGILWFIESVFPIIAAKLPDIKLYVVGNQPTKEILEKASKNIVVTGYVADEQLVEFYLNCRVVIAPLRFGAGVKGKIVEAMANRVPVVTTSMGSEGFVNIDNYVSIADEPAVFAEEVLRIYKRKSVWLRRSERSRKYIERHFTMDAGKKQILMDL